MPNICIFASGRGSNAKHIIEYSLDKDYMNVSLIVSNKKNAGVLELAKHFNISYLIVTKNDWISPEVFIEKIKSFNISLIVLAGFLWLIPKKLIQAYPNRMINIHPALLPKYGGKGMYGMNIHKAVVANGDLTSGITIHYVNEHYDEGKHIFQASVPLDQNDTPEVVASKVLSLEHKHFPRVTEQIILKLSNS